MNVFKEAFDTAKNVSGKVSEINTVIKNEGGVVKVTKNVVAESRPARRSFGQKLTVIGIIFFVPVMGILVGIKQSQAAGVAPSTTAVSQIVNQSIQKQTPNTAPIKEICALPDNWPNRILKWCEPITKAADKYNINPKMIGAMIWIESHGDPKAQNDHSLATGLMQVMPKESNVIYGCFGDRPSAKKLFNPEFNIDYGVRLLAQYLEANNGNMKAAMIQYGNLDDYRQKVKDAIAELDAGKYK